MKIGYSRISTHDQNEDLQLDSLKLAQCEKIFSDKVSGVTANRPGLDESLQYVKPEDSLVVWRLDRLGRNLKHLIEVVDDLERSNDLARKLKVSAGLVSRLINGKTDVSPAMALKVSVVLGRTPESWLLMQDNYSLWEARKDVNLDDFESISFAA